MTASGVSLDVEDDDGDDDDIWIMCLISDVGVV
jgi:hypothetical protein